MLRSIYKFVWRLLAVSLGFVVSSGAVYAAGASGTMGLRMPAVSPDGTKVAFVYQGDIWLSTLSGRSLQRLTVHSATESHPRWSPDGKQLLFTSNRSGNNDLYVISSQGGVAKRLTFHSANDIGLDWSADRKWILFSSNRENSTSLYHIPAKGGMARRLVGGYWNWVFGGRLGPQGKKMLFCEGMEAWRFWWRKGYKGPNHNRIHLYDLRTGKSRSLHQGPHEALWPMWGPKGKSYYFVSERSGVANLFRGSFSSKAPQQLTTFAKDPVRWPSIDRKGAVIVYERAFRLWQTNLRTGKSSALPIQIEVDPARSPWQTKRNPKIESFALSPDGKKLAFVSEGEVFVTDAKGKTVVRQLTFTSWRESQVTWDHDSLHLYYMAERGKGFLLIRRSARLDGKEEVVVKSQKRLLFPKVSPDGKHLLYLESKNRWMLKTGKKSPRLLVEGQIAGWMNEPAQWSPDSRWVMYMGYHHVRGALFAISVTPGAKPIRLNPVRANQNAGVWSPDGKYVVFQSNRYGSDWFHYKGDSDLYVLTLKPQPTRFKEDKLDALFKKQPSGKKGKVSAKKKKKGKAAKQCKKKKGKKCQKESPTTKKAHQKGKKGKKKGKKGKKAPKVEIQVKGLRRRVKRRTFSRGNESWPVFAPNGKSLVFFSDAGGRYQLYRASFKHGRIVGASLLSKGLRFRSGYSSHNLIWHPKGKSFYLLQRGKIMMVSAGKGSARPVRLRFQVRVHRYKRMFQMFREVWLAMRDHFYDPKMSGRDWPAIYKQYAPMLRQVRTLGDWRNYMNEMLGELNASHLGVYNPRKRSPYSTGVLGATLAVQGNGLVLRDWLEGGPLAFALQKVGAKVKQVQLLKIDGAPVDASTNPYVMLRNKVAKRVLLTLKWRRAKTSKAPKKGKNAKKQPKKPVWVEKTLKLRPISSWSARMLRYKAWVRSRQALVAKWSKGSIGYLHMRNMTRGALYQFIKDFDTDVANKKGAIIDVRFNMGGNVHDTVLEYLSRRRYATWNIRGLRRWNQPAYAVRPQSMAMMINQVTLSDGEMTASGFKALKLGPVIGTATYRWLIFTYGRGLLHGGFYRVPDWGCYAPSGKDLEKHGVTPDVTVHNTLVDRLQGRDPQLRKTVELLMNRRGKKAR